MPRFFIFVLVSTLIKNIFFAILSIATGGLFIYSAYSKIYSYGSFERFQYTIVEYVHLPWFLAANGARILTGMEIAIGALLILNLLGVGKWILKVGILLLIAFSVYLVYLWAAVGDDVNCGCFGDKIWMSPTSSLLKNALLLVVFYLLLRFHEGLRFKFSKWLAVILFVVGTASPYFIYPNPASEPNFLKKDSYELDLSRLYDNEKVVEPNVDLRKGKHIVAFMSLTCPHCRLAAYKMQLMKKDNPDIPIYFVLNGDSSKLASFWKETGAQDVPNTMAKGRDFTDLSGFSLPSIYWVNDGWVEVNSNYIDLKQADIEKWLISNSKDTVLSDKN